MYDTTSSDDNSGEFRNYLLRIHQLEFGTSAHCCIIMSLNVRGVAVAITTGGSKRFGTY